MAGNATRTLADEAESDEPVEDDGDDTSGGSTDTGDGEPQAAAGSDGGFPLGWIIGGAVALVVIAGGAAGIRLLVVRR